MKGDKAVDVQALKDIANKLRIHSIVATNASKSGWVYNLALMFIGAAKGPVKVRGDSNYTWNNFYMPPSIFTHSYISYSYCKTPETLARYWT